MQYTNRWPELAAKVKPSVQQGIKVGAFNVQANARQNAPRRSGFMGDSVYASGWWGSDYGQGGNPPGDSYLLPEVQPPDDMSAVVGAGANYSIFVEMGHHVHNSTTFVPANPWFIPGVEQARGTFEADMAQALTEGLT